MKVDCCIKCKYFNTLGDRYCKLDKNLEINIFFIYEDIPQNCPLLKGDTDNDKMREN